MHFYLIGDTGLVTKCAEILLEKGCKLLGIISKDGVIQRWAKEHNILTYSNIDEATKVLQEIEFDYLINIASTFTLPDWLLSKSKQLAINYHNGPSPSYAGMHSASWAILNNEKLHRITWYTMVEGENEGNILKQSEFIITDADTALSLNIRCYERSIKLFTELVDEIIQGKASIAPQIKFSGTFFYSQQKPLGGGILDWSSTVNEIERLCRALDFGTYLNSIAAPKLVIDSDTIYIPLKYRTFSSKCNYKPGEIISITDAYIEVAAQEGTIQVLSFCDKQGKEFSPLAIKQRHHLIEKQCLPVFSKEYQKKFTEKLVDYSFYESYWLKQWQEAQPCQLPWRSTLTFSSPTTVKTIPLFLSQDIKKVLKYYQNDDIVLIAIVLVYLSKILQKADFSLYFQNESLLLGNKTFQSFFADFIPFNAKIIPYADFDTIYQLIEYQLIEIKSQKSYAVDLLYRCRQIIKDLPQLTIAIVSTSASEKVLFPSSVALGFIIDSCNHDIHITTTLPSEYFEYISRIPLQLERLFSQVLSTPTMSVQQVPLVTPQELAQLTNWNKTQYEYPKEKTIHQLFEESVERAPDAIAIVYEDQQISYSALNGRVNQLAHYIRTLGVKVESRVGVALPRGIELIVGLLAILKAGGAYVPLDIDYPRERLGYMLEDSQVKLLLSLRKVELPDSYVGDVVYLDEVEFYFNQPIENLYIDLFPENLAYITYTSGSTGRPKGVACHHGGVINRLFWGWNNYRFKENETCCLQSSIAFVDSTWDIFGTLLVGAKLVLYKEDISKDIEVLLKTCFTHQITRITLIPSFLNTLIDFSSEKLSIHKKYLSHWEITGESFKPNLIDHFYKHIGQTPTLLDCYGATEATSVIYRDYIGKNGCEYQTKVLSNTQVHLLDTHLNLVPIGVEGEIYIGGVGLARGYLNQPGLTAERFISNPFEAGSRLYRTGDLGRYLTDGNIEFVGRIDHQVKLRGFRIELGEIEGTIEVAEAVQQAVVLCREDMPGQKRLVAYVVPKNKEDSSLVESLQNLCQNRLPDYMQPSQWVVLESLPLTPNGKIDRKGLPIPEGREGVGGYQAPEGLIEERLAQVWSELLGMEIGRRDDFFRLGGHSLLATQMVSRLREVLRLEVPLKAVFEHSVLFELARYIEHSHLQEGILPSIARVSRDKPQALSFAQQRLWFLEQLLPNTGLYHNPMSFRILGKLNIEVLRQALDAIVARHEILRTVIINSKGIALQRVLSEDTKFDLRESTENTEALIEEFIKKPFQFDSEPLCRGLLLKYSEQEHVLLLVFHHIVVDDWSMGIFYKELNAFYKTYSENKILALPPLPVQYIDYSVWQRSWLQGEVLEKQLSYWQEQLREVARLELPTDYPRPKELSYQGGFVYRKLPKELLNQLQEFSQIQGVTLFMSLLASIQGFLSRYCNQTDIAIGTPIASRRSTEVEGLIGFFVNTLVLRSQFKDNPSFETLIKQVENSTISAYEHQDVPFEQLVEYLQVSRELNRNPLFQVMFTLHPGGEKFQLGDLEVLTEEPPEYLSRFDLLINAFVDQEGLYMKFDYAKELFTGERIERLADYYETFLRAILREPSKRLSEIPLLGEQELQQLFLWNETQHEYPREKGIHQLFEETVERVPDAIAVVYEDQQISYRALNERANQLAHYLRKRGVGPDQLVAIAIERSLEMVVSLLGILKAGGAYVPIDPSYPEERLIFMLEDTRTPLLISQDSLREVFEGYNKIIFIDEIWQEIEQESKDNPQTLTLPQHLAYIIYTSGSTGKPKGVMVQHENLTHYITYAQRTYPIAPGISVFHSSYAFDMSVTSLFLPLLQGYTIGMVSKIADVETLGSYIKAHDNLNLIKLTPTHLRALREQLSESDIRRQKGTLIIGGENLLKEDIEYWQKFSSYRYLVNEYGPTETTVGCCIYQIEKESHTIPIGRPIANTEIYILDDALQAVPIGAIGEIYIGGAGLARGYWGRPELTAERFTPNPFKSNTRLYKTGDLARYLKDGNIEFLGRCDDQVKVRGYRIELGEIELVLSRHEDVAQAVVVANEDEFGIKRLVAYVVPGEFSPSPTELREYLEGILPEYMVPSFFMYIEQIPITLNGKVDRKSLPSPDFATRSLENELVAPKNENERELCEIWRTILGIEKVGIRDHFFRLGGDSIISIQLVSKARQKDIIFSVKDVFNHPTIEALASVAQSKEKSGILQAQQGEISGKVPLTPIQHWFFKQALAKPHHFNQAVLLQIKGKLDTSILIRALRDLIVHHDGLRMVYRQEEGVWCQEYKPIQKQDILIEADLSIYKGQRLSAEIIRVCNEAQGSFDLAEGVLIKVVLMSCSDESQRLLIVLHHLVIDGVSWRILLEDLEKLYYQSAQGETVSLSQKTYSYQQWSGILQDYAKSPVLQEEESYWEAIEEKIKPLLIDKLMVKELEDRLQTIQVTLSREETRLLLQKVPAAYRTEINDILLTALALAIKEWTGKQGVSISLEGHGREEIVAGIDVSRTIGWLTSMFPVYLDISEAQDTSNALKIIKETLRSIPYKGIGYGILKYLRHTKEISNFPSISFNYLGQWVEQQGKLWKLAREAAGVSVAPENKNSYLLDINAEIREGQLQIYWTFNEKHFAYETIEKVGNNFIKYLQNIIQHCCQEGVYGYTPSDFNLVSLTQEVLDHNFGKEPLLEEIYPLSSLQAGLLFQALYEPASDAYFVQSILKIEGEVNKKALQQAWQKVSDHHAILRTGFMWEGLDKPLQYVLAKVEVPFEVENWNELAKAAQEERLTRCIEADRQQGFALRQAPLFRIKLIECSKGHSYMIWSSHHILLDGWSTPIILGDVLKAYEGFVIGKEVTLKYRAPYKDYITWLEKQDKDKAQEYWQEILSSVEEPTRLSFKKVINEILPAKDYGTHEITLSIEETETIQRFAGEQHVTLNTVLQGAVGLLLQHYTQKSEVVMGVTISGRTIELTGIEEMVGLFINTLPLKIMCRSEDTIETYLKRLQTQTQQLNEYAYTSLSQIYRWTSQHEGLFDVLFVFENYPIEESVREGRQSFQITNIKGFERTEYPLTIVVVLGKEMNFIFHYQTEHFDKELIELIVKHLKTLLQSMRTNNGTPRTLAYLSNEEYKQLTEVWNTTQHPYPENKTIQQLFEEQVKETPNNIALIYENEEIIYQELNERANQLAHYLRKRGVGPDQLVAVAIERSLEMVISLLGILKAGGAYVPIDPSYPEERLIFLLEDTRAPLLISQGSLRGVFEGYNKIIFIDEIWQEIEQESKDNPQTLTLPQHLAYVIYTSGSTGKPKGVMVSHYGLSNRLLWMQDKYNLTSKDRVLLKTPFTFDVSVWELFLPLLTGSAEVIANPEFHKEPNLIFDLIIKKKVTICHFVPPMLATFLDNKERFETNTLRLVVVSGDVLSQEVVKEFYSKLDSRLHNLYGPTEASIDVTSYHCLENDCSIPSIGKPIWNIQIYILDPQLNLVPIGVSGEIYIGGVGLARGYLNRPDLTAEKFIANPFFNQDWDLDRKNLRLYCTGDLAQYLPDGNIEFLGRRDDQVKLRGVRIELGEIESVITGHEKVSQVVVLAREDQPGRKRLVAYIVPKTNEDITLIEDLRQYLNSKLPEYMVPSFFVCIDEIPLTSNGKVDRKALPSPDAFSKSLIDNYLAPRNERERQLSEIWSVVLGIEKVGIMDHFFRIGGDSIISIQLVSKARQKGIIFSVRDVFNYPTIEALASVVQDQGESGMFDAQQGRASGSVPLTPIQHWFFEQNPTVPHHYNQVMWIKSEETIDVDKLQSALKVIYNHHDGFRLRYRKGLEDWEQYYSEESELPWKVEPTWAEESLGDICTVLQSSLNIEDGPLSQLVWFAEKGQLLWIIHHLIVDGVSWRILLEDLNLAYAGKALSPKSHSYMDWSRSLSQYVSMGEIEYYQTQLQAIPRLPSDYTYSGYVPLKDVKGLSIEFSKQTTKRFLQEAHQSFGTTPDDLLLLALIQAVGDCFGKYQLCLDLEGHGREDLGSNLDLTRTVGWFTCIHPVVLTLPEPFDIGQSIKHIKEHLRRIPQKGVCYGILNQIQKTYPLVRGDIVFNYLGQWQNIERKEETFFFIEGNTGLSASLDNPHSHPLAVNGGVNQGQLKFYWTYSTLHYKTETIEKLSKIFNERFEALIEYCTEGKHFGYSPSDFPYIKLDGRQLDNLLKKIGGKSNA